MGDLVSMDRGRRRSAEVIHTFALLRKWVRQSGKDEVHEHDLGQETERHKTIIRDGGRVSGKSSQTTRQVQVPTPFDAKVAAGTATSHHTTTTVDLQLDAQHLPATESNMTISSTKYTASTLSCLASLGARQAQEPHGRKYPVSLAHDAGLLVTI